MPSSAQEPTSRDQGNRESRRPRTRLSGKDVRLIVAMDPKVVRSRKDKVLRQLARLLAPFGFKRTKPTFFTRRHGLVVQFIHTHKFSFTESFRVHLGVRVLADVKDYVHLNGPDSTPWQARGAPGGRKFDFSFHGQELQVDKAAVELAAFVEYVAQPWFGRFAASDALLGPGSPLSADEQEQLRRAQRGEAVSETATTHALGSV